MGKFLTPETIARLGNLQLVARMVVSGVLSGHHKSPHFGFNIEFAEHRSYQPGDEPRHIDWNYFAKTDQYFVKQFEESTSLRGFLLLDRSRSMSFGKGPLSKLEYARHLIAAIAYMLLHQQDRVGLGSFTDRMEAMVEPSSNPVHLHRILDSLAEASEHDETAIAAVLGDLAGRLKQPNLVVIVSDFLDEPEEILAGVRALRHRRHDVVLLPVLSPEEIDFNYDGMVRFEDLEDASGHMTVDTSALKERYKEAFENHLNTLTNGVRELGGDLEVFRTDEAMEEGLGRYLSRRARGGGRRA